jgi:hypothetical protein
VQVVLGTVPVHRMRPQRRGPVNAYWDAVRPYVVDGVVRQRTDLDPGNNAAWRDGMRLMYSWTITDPDTVAFVAEHMRPYGDDLFAGNGWWPSVLWQAHRCQVRGWDLVPQLDPWEPVIKEDAATVAPHLFAGPLLLSWPPRYAPIGERTIRAYRGNRIVHIGAEGRTSDGTDAMRHILRTEWTQIAQHTPVRWYGVKDYVTVYERN